MNIQLDSDQFKELIQEELQKHMPDSEPQAYMLDVNKACNYLSVSRPTLYALVNKCDIPSYKVGSKKLYKRTDIEYLADELTERSKAKNYDLLESD